MRIVETNIPDIVEENLDRSKIVLAESVIENIYPLFDAVFNAKMTKINNLKRQINAKKEKIRSEKETVQELIDEYNRRKKASKLLNRVEKLVEAGLTYDGSIKHETVILLKIIDKLPADKLDLQLAKTMQIINKRFAR